MDSISTVDTALEDDDLSTASIPPHLEEKILQSPRGNRTNMTTTTTKVQPPGHEELSSDPSSSFNGFLQQRASTLGTNLNFIQISARESEAAASVRDSDNSVKGFFKSHRRKESNELFHKLDTNNSKSLDSSKIAKFVASNDKLWALLSISLEQPEQQCQRIATNVTMELASGLEGPEALEAQITKEQFYQFRKRYILNPQGSQEFFHRTVFATFDVDSNSLLDAAELENFFATLYNSGSVYLGDVRLPPQEDLMAVMLQKLDSNDNQKLTFDVFYQLLKDYEEFGLPQVESPDVGQLLVEEGDDGSEPSSTSKDRSEEQDHKSEKDQKSDEEEGEEESDEESEDEQPEAGKGDDEDSQNDSSDEENDKGKADSESESDATESDDEHDKDDSSSTSSTAPPPPPPVPARDAEDVKATHAGDAAQGTKLEEAEATNGQDTESSKEETNKEEQEGEAAPKNTEDCKETDDHDSALAVGQPATVSNADSHEDASSVDDEASSSSDASSVPPPPPPPPRNTSSVETSSNEVDDNSVASEASSVPPPPPTPREPTSDDALENKGAEVTAPGEEGDAEETARATVKEEQDSSPKRATLEEATLDQAEKAETSKNEDEEDNLEGATAEEATLNQATEDKTAQNEPTVGTTSAAGEQSKPATESKAKDKARTAEPTDEIPAIYIEALLAAKLAAEMNHARRPRKRRAGGGGGGVRLVGWLVRRFKPPKPRNIPHGENRLVVKQPACIIL